MCVCACACMCVRAEEEEEEEEEGNRIRLQVPQKCCVMEVMKPTRPRCPGALNHLVVSLERASAAESSRWSKTPRAASRVSISV